MATANDIITRAYKMAGILGEGEVMTSDLADDGLVYLNDLMQGLSNEQNMIFQNTEESITMTGATSYTWGSGGTINTARPQKITGAFFRLNGTNVDYPVDVLTKDEYDGIGEKTITTDILNYVYLYNSYPLAELFVYPVASNGTLHITTWKALSEFATGTTAVSLPNGYERMLKIVLADEIGLEFGRSNPELTRRAIDAKAWIKRLNNKPKVASIYLPVSGNGYYDSYSIKRGY